MKKFAISIVLLFALILSACGSSSSSSAQKSMIETLSGTYVGKNGSVLTLFPDGKSEYYYMRSNCTDSKAGSWSCDDQKLTWTYNGVPITAALDNLSSSSFILSSANGWTREQFSKVSDVAEYKSVAKCREILRQSLNRPEMDNFDESLNTTCTIGNVAFSIPFYWQKDGDDYIAEDCSQDNAYALLEFGEDKSGNSGIEDNDFLSVIENILKEHVDSIIQNSGGQIIQSPSKLYTQNYVGAQVRYQTNYNGELISCTATVINNPTNNSLVFVILGYTDRTMFKYDSDYNKIINSIVPVSTSSSNSPNSGGGRADASSNTSGASVNGVTPELKAFLDSYEAYMDQYILFMQKYENSDDPYTMLSDYLAMMQRYSEFADALNNYDTDNMSDADSAYYFEVTMRVAQKLLAAAQ